MLGVIELQIFAPVLNVQCGHGMVEGEMKTVMDLEIVGYDGVSEEGFGAMKEVEIGGGV